MYFNDKKKKKKLSSNKTLHSSPIDEAEAKGASQVGTRTTCETLPLPAWDGLLNSVRNLLSGSAPQFTEGERKAEKS